jgi:hypothetical protein
MRALVLLALALSAGCSERALGIFDPNAPILDGDVDAGSSKDLAGPRAPGGLPDVYCERMVVLGDGGQLALFDPVALTFTDTAKIACPAQGAAKAYSIALDLAGVLWVAHSSGEIFTADAQTGACTGPVALDPSNVLTRRTDITFAPDAESSSGERLYLVMNLDDGGGLFGSLDPSSPFLTRITELPAGLELTTTGSGELWGLSRGAAPKAMLLDRETGAVTRELSLGSRLGNITGNGVAFSWFRDQFYVFLLPQESTTSVFRVSPIDGKTERIARRTGRNLISATAARCLR